MIDRFLGDDPSFVLPVLEYCFAVWCPAAETRLKLQDPAVSAARFLPGGYLSVILLIVDLWQYCVCCIISGVTRCTLLMVLYLEQSCWLRIRWCGTGGFQEKGQWFFIGLSCFIPTILFYYFSISLLSVYRLVLWDWGLRTDRRYITLSQLCTADLF